MTINTTHLGGTASDIVVGRISHGLMHSDDEVSFASIKAGVDRLPPGAKMILNSALAAQNLEMLGRFFARYPEYAEKTTIMEPDCSMEGMRRSIDTIEHALGPHKKMDAFQPARIDPKVSIEKMMANLVVLLKEGHFSHIGLSECGADTLRRAHAIHPITVAEIEVSLTSYETETKRVIETARELGISVLAYSPVAHGLLSGTIKSIADVPENDFRRRLDRFQAGNIEHNLDIVSILPKIAAENGVTQAQIAIAWVASLGPHVIPLPGSSVVERTLENCAAGDIELSAEEIKVLNAIAEGGEVKGARYFGGNEEAYFWG
ncbi:Aldo/keto reductase [Favolaschia claudopus]|uniref:Aldo/keto reductase n=1 Tax=Favolaschia claudopus TaxID=2862362 RepID=A0AAW0DVV5_9AGAR